MVQGQGLDIVDIEAGAGDGPVLQRHYQGRFLDDGATGGVDEEGRRLHFGEFAGADETPCAVAQHGMDGDHVAGREQFLEAHLPDADFGAALPGQVLAPGDDVHLERLADRGHPGADLAETDHPQHPALDRPAKRRLPSALAGRPVLFRNVAHERQDQGPGQLRRSIPNGLGAADDDAPGRRRIEVDGEVAHPGGDQQPQIGQIADQGGRKRRALAHDHDDVEIPQPFGDRVRIGEMVVEHVYIGPLGDGRPVRHLQGDVLEIV